jgi:hypothetical protein
MAASGHGPRILFIMSIYVTIGEIGIRRFGDETMIEIMIQAVPAHIDYAGPQWDFLPPTVDPNGETNRAVFLVERGTTKGTERCGQEYVKPLLMLTGAEYEKIGFSELLGRLEEALDRKYGPRPIAIYYGPKGARRNLHSANE